MDENQGKDERTSGWMYLWGVARVNGIQYTGSPDNITHLKLLVSGCPTQKADKPELEEAGFEMYQYTKHMEHTDKFVHGQGVMAVATAKIKDEAEWNSVKQMMRDTIDSVGSSSGRSNVREPKAAGKPPKAAADAKTTWMKFATKALLDTQKIIDDVVQVEQRLSEVEAPWNSKKFRNTISKFKAETEKLRSRLLGLKNMHCNMGPEVFTNSKFTEIETAIKDMLEAAQQSKHPVRVAKHLLSSA